MTAPDPQRFTAEPRTTPKGRTYYQVKDHVTGQFLPGSGPLSSQANKAATLQETHDRITGKSA